MDLLQNKSSTRRRRSPDLSIVIPLYNEEECVEPLYASLKRTCERLDAPRGYEIIFVDDGSTDRTYARAQALHAQDRTVKVIKFKANYGQTAAMAAGLRLATGRTIVTMDGDLQNDPDDIPTLLRHLDRGYDVVCGWRKARQDTVFARKIPSLTANWLIRVLTKVPIHDTGCSLRAYRSRVAKKIPLHGEMHRFIPSLASLEGARIAEIVVTHHPRTTGTSKYGISRTWGVLLDLILVNMLTGLKERPLVWFGGLSVPAMLLGSASFLHYLFSSQGIVFSSLAFLFVALVGHLLMVGMLGELVLSTTALHQDGGPFVNLAAPETSPHEEDPTPA